MVVLDSYAQSNADSMITMQAYPLDRSVVYQSFTTLNDGINYKLTSIQAQVALTSGSTGTFQVEVYAETGSTYGTDSAPTGSVLATSDIVSETTINAANASGALTSFSFTGANQITLTANTQYVLAIKCLTLTGVAAAWVDATSPTHGGNCGTWTSA